MAGRAGNLNFVACLYALRHIHKRDITLLSGNALGGLGMFQNTFHLCSPHQIRVATTEQLRSDFLITGLFDVGQVRLHYVYQERMIVGGVMPCDRPLFLPAFDETPGGGSVAMLNRREMAVINIGMGSGTILVDGTCYRLARFATLYVGQGAESVCFASDDSARPAKFYLTSTPAHAAFPTRHIDLSQGKLLKLGSQEQVNRRSIYQLVEPSVCPSAQLLFGLTILEPGSVWNTNPPHRHLLRSEIYLYCDMDAADRVFHFMGTPDETRHLVVRQEEAVICPSWSIHMGAGSGRYAFVWAMGGENQDYDDIERLSLTKLR